MTFTVTVPSPVARIVTARPSAGAVIVVSLFESNTPGPVTVRVPAYPVMAAPVAEIGRYPVRVAACLSAVTLSFGVIA